MAHGSAARPICRWQSRVMFESNERAERAKGRSLLSLGLALEEERARAQAVEAAGQVQADAASRHRYARAQHETKPGGLMEALAAARVQSDEPDMPIPPADESLLSTLAARDTADENQHRALTGLHPAIAGIARSKVLIASTALAGALLGAVVVLSQPKTFEARSEVLVGDGDPASQARILISPPMLTKIVQKLSLANDAEFSGQSRTGFLTLVDPAGLLRLPWSNGQAGNADPQVRAIAALAGRLSVERDGNSLVLAARTDDAGKSALIANTLVNAFLDEVTAQQSAEIRRAAAALTSGLDDLRGQVEAAENNVETFRSEKGIFDAQGRSVADDELTKLNDQLAQARAKTLEIEAKARSAQQLDINAVTAALPEDMTSNTMTELRAQYAGIKQAVDYATVRFGPRHSQRRAAEAQLAGAEEQIRAELRRIVSSLQVELKRAVDVEQSISVRLDQLKLGQAQANRDMIELRQLEREANSKQAVYDAFLLGVREMGEQNLSAANVRVISTASQPLEPVGPSPMASAAIGAFLGLLAGLGIAATRGTATRSRVSTIPHGHAVGSTAKIPTQADLKAPSETPVTAPSIIPNDIAASISDSISDIRETLRECRDALRLLADRHARRFF